MSSIGQPEIVTQRRVAAFFQNALGYDYLSDWKDRPENSNVERDILRNWLRRNRHDDRIITRTLDRLRKPDATLIGFTGTPLLKADKARSIEIFGPYIKPYKYDEAVRDGVVLDLRYEARDIDQELTSQAKIDQWFEAKTAGLTDLAKAQLKQRWGTMRRVLSAQGRLQKIVADIVFDMGTRDRLKSGRGNALLVSDSIYAACRLYEMFENTALAGKCAVVTSYEPTPADIKGEETGEGLTEKLRKYEIYRKRCADPTFLSVSR